MPKQHEQLARLSLQSKHWMEVRLEEDAAAYREQCLHVAADELVASITEQGGERRVDGGDDTVIEEADDSARKGIECRARVSHALAAVRQWRARTGTLA